MEPSFTTPLESIVLTLPKIKVVGIERVYVSNEDKVNDSKEKGGQKGGQKSGQKDVNWEVVEQ